jgi:hypothetical protein
VRILDGERPNKRRLDDMNAAYMLGALTILLALWIA